jgi:hypothetical protein
MNTSPFLLVSITALLTSASSFAAQNSLSVPLPGGRDVSAVLEIIDESASAWKSLPVTISESANGFTGSFTGPSGEAATLEGSFVKSDGNVKCSVKWENAPASVQTFMMLVLVLPADQAGETVLTSGKETITIAKLLAGESTSRANFTQTSSFSMGPLDGKSVNFDCDTPMDVGVTAPGQKDHIHVRLGLTPRKSDMPASGEAVWTMSE